jgi:hypothetical protein
MVCCVKSLSIKTCTRRPECSESVSTTETTLKKSLPEGAYATRTAAPPDLGHTECDHPAPTRGGLTREAEQDTLATNAQEHTGAWTGHPLPARPVPTQELGVALYAEPDVEGVVTMSAQVPYFQILVVFPEKLQAGGLVTVPAPH